MSIIPLLRDAGVQCFTREQWGSPMQEIGAYARRRHTHPMPGGKAKYHFLHLTVTSDTDTVKQGAEGARQIESYGYSTPAMVSYHDLITNEGRYYEGQNYGVKGTHTVNDKEVGGYPIDLNLYGYATALMQNVEDEVTDEQVRLAALCAAAREIKGYTEYGAPILPHRMFAWKACPGDKAVARLDEIRKLKEKFVRNFPEEDEMAKYRDWEDADKQALVNDLVSGLLDATVDRNPKQTVRQALRQADNAPGLIRQLAREHGFRLDGEPDEEGV